MAEEEPTSDAHLSKKLRRRLDNKARIKQLKSLGLWTKKPPRDADECVSGTITESEIAETTYDTSDGVLRRVRPYWYEFRSRAKERWIGVPLCVAFSEEFNLPIEYCRSRAMLGRLRVNGEVSDPDRAIASGDAVTNSVHRHEPPVTVAPVRIIGQTDELVVVDKPASIPVHPVGAFRHNTVTFILASECGLRKLHSIHRLDRLTSGVLLFAKSSDAARKYKELHRTGVMQKTYVARVRGSFPDGGGVTVDQPIETLESDGKRGAKCRVGPSGAPSLTTFRRLLFDPKTATSVVLCKPLTGRIHQIRVHLAWMGFPVANDPLYCDDLYASRPSWFVAEDCDEPDAVPPTGDSPAAGAIDKSAPLPHGAVPGCSRCLSEWPDPSQDELVMWLHAFSYEGPGWRFEAPLPQWALGVKI